LTLSIRYSLRARQEEIELLEYMLREFGHTRTKEIFYLYEKMLSPISKLPDMYLGFNTRKVLWKSVFGK
jgi:hypothetical protein